jgi:hypothetical protein
MASRTTLARLTQAGIVPVSTNAVFCELQRTWNRPDAADFAALYGAYAPNYQDKPAPIDTGASVTRPERGNALPGRDEQGRISCWT